MSKDSTSATSRRRMSRGWLAAGALGVAAVVGGAAFAIGDGLTEETETAVAEIGAPASATGEAVPLSPSAAVTQPPASTGSSGASSTVEMPSRAVTAPPSNPAQRLANAKKAGAGDVKVKRPLVTQQQLPGEVSVTERGSVRTDGKMLRVVSARKDLTGHSELGWVAGAGERVGNAHCTQEIRLSNENKPKKRPTLLICWRTSAERSVYTVSVNVKQPPSKRESVAAIDKAWTKLR